MGCYFRALGHILCINVALGPLGLRAFGAIGDLGLSMFWSLGHTSLRTVGTKEPFEALGHMAYMGFSTFGVLCTFTMPYCSINRDTHIRLHLILFYCLHKPNC